MTLSLSEFLNSIGLSSLLPKLDGKPHRLKNNQSIWYVGSEGVTKNGNTYQSITVGDWSDEGFRHSYNSAAQSKNSVKFTPAELKEIEEERKLKAAQLEVEKEKEHEAASQIAKSKCSEISSTDNHPYLTSKGISGFFVNVVGDSIIVPMRDENEKIWSYQTISQDGTKMFLGGGRKKGLFSEIAGNNERTYICEGYATGISTHLATGNRVIVAFDCHNVVNVAKFFPGSIIAADNDIWKKANAGINAAKKTGLCYTFPVFDPKFNSTEPTDFNDLHKLVGLEEVSRQLADNLVTVNVSPVPPTITTKDEPLCAINLDEITFLGHKNNDYYYTSNENKQIRSINVNAHTHFGLVDLMDESKWRKVFPKKNAEGDVVGVRWHDAAYFVISKNKQTGIFNPDKIRGLGVWKDGKKIVCHLGEKIWMDGGLKNLNEINEKFVYPLQISLPEPSKEMATAEEGIKLVKALSRGLYRKSESHILVAGFLFVCRLGAALPWRPHMYLTGGRGSGKSVFFKNIVEKCLGEMLAKCASATTEPGIRQRLESSCLPVVFDEFDKEGSSHDDERLQAIIALARHSSSEFDAKVIKGSSNQKAVEYTVRSCFLLGSIRVPLINDSDKSRFIIVELLKEGQSPEQYAEFLKTINELGDGFSEKLLSRALSCFDLLCENYKILQAELGRRHDQRFGQLYGIVLAGYITLISDSVITKEEAVSLISSIDLTEEAEHMREQDHDFALDHILHKKLSIDTANGKKDTNLIQMVEAKNHEALRLLGCKIKNKDGKTYLQVLEKHPEFESILKGTNWQNSWLTSIKRNKERVTRSSLWWEGKSRHCVDILIPHQSFESAAPF